MVRLRSAQRLGREVRSVKAGKTWLRSLPERCRKRRCSRPRSPYHSGMPPSVRTATKPAPSARRIRLGLIVNPIAGMGGAAGLKGTDGADTLREALARGATPVAAHRAERALRKLLPLVERIDLLAAAGDMGARLARRLGFDVTEIGAAAGETTAADTRAAAAAMRAQGVDLILFAGGDGTARDVFDGAPDAAMLGVPTGVKMHSAVFGVSPEAAGQIAAATLSGEAGATRWREAEVMDIDEAALRGGRVSARLHGYARVPAERAAMQNCKTPARGDDEPALAALARRIVREMEEGRLYVLGCGTTMRHIKRELKSEGTLLGVDVALNGRLIARDVDEARLTRLTAGALTSVIVSATGGQGYIFGRGNQQIGPALLRRIGRDSIMVVTGTRKLTALDPPCLRVDTGDPEVDAMLAGYVRVHTAPGQSMMMRVAA
jgi:predicted polyphosphate/ATP-dependent NAD kinase